MVYDIWIINHDSANLFPKLTLLPLRNPPIFMIYLMHPCDAFSFSHSVDLSHIVLFALILLAINP
jgi:hypothetical protein